MPDTTPAQRVAEYLRQRPLGGGQDPENISEIWFDVDAESIRLTASDLEELLAELAELRGTLDRYEEIIQTNPIEAGVKVQGGEHYIYPDPPLCLRAGLRFTFRMSPDTTDEITVSTLDDASGLEIYAMPGRTSQRGAGLFFKPVTGNVVNVVLR